MTIAVTLNFFGPEIRGILGTMEAGDPSHSAAISSAKAASLAISCTAIMNAHPAGSDIYRAEWNTAMNNQVEGSEVIYSCKDAVPASGPQEEQEVQRGAVFPENVQVICDPYNTPGGGCDIKNFKLPQRVRQPGLAVSPGYLENLVFGALGPRYVLYYQALPVSAKRMWLKRTEGLNWAMIAVGGAATIVPMGAARVAPDMGLAARVGDSYVGRALSGAANGRLARLISAIGSVATKMADLPIYLGRLGKRAVGIIYRKGLGIPPSFVSDFGEAYARNAEDSLQEMGGLGLRKFDDAGEYRVTLKGDITEDRLTEAFEQSFRDAADDAAEGVPGRSADEILGAFSDDEIERIARQDARRLLNNAEIADDALAPIPREVAEEMGPEEALSHGARLTATADSLVNSWRAGLTRAGSSGVRASVREFTEESTQKARALLQTSDDSMVRQLARSGRNAFCSAAGNTLLRAEAFRTIARGATDGADQTFWTNIAECQALVGGLSGGQALTEMCDRGGVIGDRNTWGSLTATVTGQQACVAATAIGFGIDTQLRSSVRTTATQGNINALYLHPWNGGPIKFPLHPIANYYFTALTQRDPNARFFLASPFYTNPPNTGDNTGRLKFRGGTVSYVLKGQTYARRSRNDGNHGAARFWGPRGNWDPTCGFGRRLVGNIKNVVEDVGGVAGLDLQEQEFIEGAIPQDAIENNLKGSYTTNGAWRPLGWDCPDQIIYTGPPQVIRTGGPKPRAISETGRYPLFPEAETSGTTATGAGAVLYSDEDVYQPDQECSDPCKSRGVTASDGLMDVAPSWDVKSVRVTPSDKCTLHLCTDAGATETGHDSCSTYSQGNLEDPMEVEKAAVICDDLSEEYTSSGAGTTQKVKTPGPSPSRAVGLPNNYWQQTWYWYDDCGGSGGCRFKWEHADRGATGLADTELPRANNKPREKMVHMYPRIRPDGRGVTKYQAKTAMMGALGAGMDMADLSSATKVKDMRTVRVSVEGMGGKWKYRVDGTTYANYGWNDFIEETQLIQAGLVLGTIALEFFSDGIPTTVIVGAAVVGEAGMQWLPLVAAWPKHGGP